MIVWATLVENPIEHALYWYTYMECKYMVLVINESYNRDGWSRLWRVQDGLRRLECKVYEENH